MLHALGSVCGWTPDEDCYDYEKDMKNAVGCSSNNTVKHVMFFLKIPKVAKENWKTIFLACFHQMFIVNAAESPF